MRVLEEAWEAQDPVPLASADAQFHLALAAASHNTLMLAVASGLNIVLERFMRTSHASAHSEESFRTHRIIYRAVAQHDPIKAERRYADAGCKHAGKRRQTLTRRKVPAGRM